MTRSSLFFSFSSASALVVLLSFAPGCNRECQSYNDCPEDEHCDESYVCVANDGDYGNGSGLPGDGDGDGDGDGGTGLLEQVQTNFEPSWLIRDPRPGANQLLFPEYDGINVDHLNALDLAAETVGPEQVNFQELQDPQCDLVNVAFEPNIVDADSDGETWLVCAQGAQLRVIYGDEFSDPALEEPQPVNEGGITVTPFADDGVNFNRRVWFTRGGATLAIYQLNDADTINVSRQTDTVAPTFTAITQVWSADTSSQGDTLVVLDRADPPTLTPLFRQDGTTVWDESLLGLTTVELPATTYAVWLVGEVDEEGQSADQNVPNVMTIEPSIGRLGFYYWGQGGTFDDLGETIFEQENAYRMDPADAEERLLLSATPSGSYVMYAHPASSRVWRLPLAINQDNNVYRFTFADTGFLPSGAVAVADNIAWVAVPSEKLLFKVELDTSN